MPDDIKILNQYQQITDEICRPLFKPTTKLWFFAFFPGIAGIIIGIYGVYCTFYKGIGTWGLNRTVGWGWAITNFVWWIGIGHAGTFISAILLLFRQEWRTGINRAAETMTIFAILCAAVFPVIHMGRVEFAFFAFPYPNTRNLWVNFNSPLLWDVFAISTYFIVSLIFWYIGMIPDLAVLSGGKAKKIKRKIYSALSLGWQGTAFDWKRHEKTMILLASLATPLVISVHSVVSMDFATSIIPGWHSTIFPPYFVAGAIFSGFAMVQTLVIITRKILKLENYITLKHIDSMNKIILLTGSMVALAYVVEAFYAIYSGNEFEEFVLLNRATGPFALGFWIMIFCNMIIPQLFWFKKIRRNIRITFLFSLLINFGMWMERFTIITVSLQRDFMPSNWAYYRPTFVEVALFIGTIGLFFTLYLLFLRLFPVVSFSEIKHQIKENE